MKKIIVVIALSLLVSACASTKPTIVQPLPPERALKSDYRRTQEVILISCNTVTLDVPDEAFNAYFTRNVKKYNKATVTTSVVEATNSGERFEVAGCFGTKGERFKIAY